MQTAMIHSIVDGFFEIKKSDMKRQLYASVDLLVENLVSDLACQVKQFLLPNQPQSGPTEYTATHKQQPPQQVYATKSLPVKPQSPPSSGAQPIVKSPNGKFKFFKSRDKDNLLKMSTVERSSSTSSVAGSEPSGRITTKQVVNSPSAGAITLDICYDNCNAKPIDIHQTHTQPMPIFKNVKYEINKMEQVIEAVTPKIPRFTCQHNGCRKTFNRPADFRRHQRRHLQIKPYRCIWPGCQFQCSDCWSATRHVRSTHFRRSSREGQEDREAKWNPKVYIEVNKALLDSVAFQ